MGVGIPRKYLMYA